MPSDPTYTDAIPVSPQEDPVCATSPTAEIEICLGVPGTTSRPTNRLGLGAFKLAIPGILLVLACLLPFLNKAYTIDDPAFLLEARQILRTPLQPMSFEICWGAGNVTCAKSGSKAKFGPALSQALMGYVLVPVILAGGAEWLTHALQALLAYLAVFEMVKLVLRLGGDRMQAVAGGLLLVAIPPFLPMANTAMPDLVAMTLGLTGIERLLAWKDSRRWHQAVFAAVTLGLAPFARPHLVLLLPLGALWLVDSFNIADFRSGELHIGKALKQLRRQAFLWVPLLAAACILIALNLATRPPAVAQELTARFTDPGMLPRNLYSYFLYFSFPIPFAAIVLGMQWRKSPVLLISPLVIILAAHFVLRPATSLAHDWATAAVLYGLVSCVYLIYAYWRERDWSGLLLSLWTLIPLPVVIYQHLPIKYLLAAMPAIVLILLRTLSTLTKSRAMVVYGVLVVGFSAYSCLILRADADFAEYGRRAAAELIAPRVAAGEKVWFGGQWGFYWYAEQAGAKVAQLDGPGPQPGDLLAVGLMEGGNLTLDRFPKRELLESSFYDSPHGRSMGYSAGLYSNAFGNALWVWNPSAFNTYQLWRIH